MTIHPRTLRRQLTPNQAYIVSRLNGDWNAPPLGMSSASRSLLHLEKRGVIESKYLTCGIVLYRRMEKT